MRTDCNINLQERKIVHGDRIFASLRMNHTMIFEATYDSVGSITDLLALMRKSTRGRRGLTRLYIRNMTRGWSIERPLMLYPDTFSSEQLKRNAENSAHYTPTPSRTMLFPWETH